MSPEIFNIIYVNIAYTINSVSSLFLEHKPSFLALQHKGSEKKFFTC
jgi:hypothetical protein